MGRDKKDIRLRTKITISFASIFLFFLLSEVIFRIIDKKSYQYEMHQRFEIYKDKERQKYIRIPLDIRDPYIFCRAPKGFEFRGIKYKIAKDRNMVRIICLGDSCTQGFMEKGGYYMKTRETYPSCLERLLNSYNMNPDKHFEVMNAGVGGYSSLQGLRYFQRELLKYNPDIVTFYFGINDKDSAFIYSDGEQKIFPPRVSMEEYRNNLEILHTITKQKGIKLAIINFPSNPPDEIIMYNNILINMANQDKIPLVDIVRIAKRYKNNVDEIFVDDCHPTPYFNRIIAKEIYKILVLNKYI